MVTTRHNNQTLRLMPKRNKKRRMPIEVCFEGAYDPHTECVLKFHMFRTQVCFEGAVPRTRYNNQQLRLTPKQSKKSTPGLQECGKKERAHWITGVRKEKDFPFSTSVASKNEQ